MFSIIFNSVGVFLEIHDMWYVGANYQIHAIDKHYQN